MFGASVAWLADGNLFLIYPCIAQPILSGTKKPAEAGLSIWSGDEAYASSSSFSNSSLLIGLSVTLARVKIRSQTFSS